MIKICNVADVFAVNSYFCIDDKTGHGFLIDPGAEAGFLSDVIDKKGWTIEKILLTHGHIDHIGAVAELSAKYGIPYYIHEEGRRYLTDQRWNLCAFCNRRIVLTDAHYLSDVDVISLDSNSDYHLQVIYTPGHTLDSITYYKADEHVAFVGDTIFRGCPGSTEYIGSNKEQLCDSIYNKILTLPKDTILYSGHTEPTSVGKEMSMYKH